MERGFGDFERGLKHLVETISVIDDLPYTFEQAVRRQGEQNVFRSLQRHFMGAQQHTEKARSYPTLQIPQEQPFAGQLIRQDSARLPRW